MPDLPAIFLIPTNLLFDLAGLHLTRVVLNTTGNTFRICLHRSDSGSQIGPALDFVRANLIAARSTNIQSASVTIVMLLILSTEVRCTYSSPRQGQNLPPVLSTLVCFATGTDSSV